MWSDRTPPDRLRALVSRLHSAFPAQGAGAPPRPDSFVWLNGGDGGPRLLRQPLAEACYWGGYAVVSGPGGRINLAGCGFEILEAMLAAWRDSAGALLAG